MQCLYILAITLAVVTTSLAQSDSKKFVNSRLNYFDIDLLRQATEEKDGNVVLSPASVKAVLAMILEAAQGHTAEEIRSAMGLSVDKDDFREQLNSFLQALQLNTSSTQLESANAIFASENLKIKKDYETMLKHVYLSELQRVNFKNPDDVVKIVNGWVYNKTKGFITEVVDPAHVNPETSVVLVNALYFKSAWLKGFNSRFTRSRCFYKKGVCKQVSFMEMQNELNYGYIRDLGAHAIELPYKDNKHSMLLLVPQEKNGLSTLIRDLPYVSFPYIIQQMELNDVQLSLPKFTVDYNEDLVATLRNMKIRSLFSTTADLPGMFVEDQPQINSFYHKVHLEVNEEGTVAAAATAAMVVPLMNSGVQVTVDRPFVFFIRDKELGLTLFEGKIEEPNGVVETNKLNEGPSQTSNKNLPRTLSGKRRYYF